MSMTTVSQTVLLQIKDYTGLIIKLDFHNVCRLWLLLPHEKFPRCMIQATPYKQQTPKSEVL